MNKIFYILFVSILFSGMMGCQKVDIRPHTNCEEERIEGSEKANRDSDDGGLVRDEDKGEGITDPNNDEDEDEQIRR